MSKDTGQFGEPQKDQPPEEGGTHPRAASPTMGEEVHAEWSTAAERVTETAKEQAGIAADALRRGEFMQDATVDSEASGDDRLIGLLCYATPIVIPLIMPIIVLLSESSKKRPFQRYHAVQSLALNILFMALGALTVVGTTIISIIPVIGTLIGIVVFCLSPIAYLMAMTAFVYYGYQAYKGKRFAIPGLTSFLRDQEWL